MSVDYRRVRFCLLQEPLQVYGASIPDVRNISANGSANCMDPSELKWSLSRYRKLVPLSG